jgi:hypothetical protein
MLKLIIERKIAVRILTIFFAITFSSFMAYAQKTEDILYLKNGSILRGIIIGTVEGVVKIETYGGNLFAFALTDVAKTEKEIIRKDSKTIKQKGYVNFTSMGVLLGSSVNDKPTPFSVIMEHNYKFNNYFAVGGAIGLESLNENTVPVALNLKIFVPLQNGSIFISTLAGYSFSTGKPSYNAYGLEGIKSASGGIMANIDLGYIIPVSESAAIYAALGYRYNELNYKLESWLNDADRKIKYNRFSVRIGLSIY